MKSRPNEWWSVFWSFGSSKKVPCSSINIALKRFWWNFLSYYIVKRIKAYVLREGTREYFLQIAGYFFQWKEAHFSPYLLQHKSNMKLINFTDNLSPFSSSGKIILYKSVWLNEIYAYLRLWNSIHDLWCAKENES